ncbi:uncharacterized protein LOC123635533 isoform X4 [Lemur catta]|uniref:uncharacterized protein LOC123635533 isoform X4 n=1 Tax=Lemur catta TaxID=9447 RepID=UPI001E26945A|nr:uncharacterized protein LOC123635533 isoform X4 [Lemur catta]
MLPSQVSTVTYSFFTWKEPANWKILPSALGIPLDVSQVLQDLEPSSFFYIWHMLWPPQAPGLSSCSSSKSCGDTILFCCMHSGDVTYFIWEFLTLAQISKEFSNVFILKKSAYKCTRLQDQGSTVPHSQVSVQRGNLLTKETSYQKKHSCFCFLIIYCTQDD